MSLKEIAALMRREAQRDGIAEQTLSGGLILVMRRESKSQWSLSMKRAGAWPDAREQATIRRFFSIPKKIEGKKESAAGYRMIKLAWTDNDEKAAKAPKPVQPRLM